MVESRSVRSFTTNALPGFRSLPNSSIAPSLNSSTGSRTGFSRPTQDESWDPLFWCTRLLRQHTSSLSGADYLFHPSPGRDSKHSRQPVICLVISPNYCLDPRKCRVEEKWVSAMESRHHGGAYAMGPRIPVRRHEVMSTTTSTLGFRVPSRVLAARAEETTRECEDCTLPIGASTTTLAIVLGVW